MGNMALNLGPELERDIDQISVSLLAVLNTTMIPKLLNLGPKPQNPKVAVSGTAAIIIGILVLRSSRSTQVLWI